MIGRRLVGDEARAWAISAEFRKVVKGQLVCKSLDSDDDDPDIEIYVDGALVYRTTLTDDPHQEFFDCDVDSLGAEEREILTALKPT